MNRSETPAPTWSARVVDATLTFCVDFPRLTISVILLLTVWAILQLPKITTDTDPENMLEPDAPVRVSHESTKRTFGIHELIVVGFESERDLFNVDDLAKLFRINRGILNITGVIIPDVLSLVTTDTMRKSGDTLEIRKLLERPPQTQEDVLQLKDALLGNPLFREKLISLVQRIISHVNIWALSTFSRRAHGQPFSSHRPGGCRPC